VTRQLYGWGRYCADTAFETWATAVTFPVTGPLVVWRLLYRREERES
jgi:hypothetical protein